MLDLRPTVKEVLPVRFFLNSGACMDVPTGHIVYGKYGEAILNGGVGAITGMVGGGNQFKTTILYHQLLTVCARYNRMAEEFYRGQVYDTENNLSPQRLMELAEAVRDFNGYNPFISNTVVLTSSQLHLGDEWYDKYHEFIDNKEKNFSKIMVRSPMLGRDGNCIEIPLPTYSMVDSFSEFVTKDVVKMQDDNSLGEAGGTTIPMRQGLQKNRFLAEVPNRAGKVYDYLFLTAHIGDVIEVDKYKPTRKLLQHLPQGVKIKGVPPKFTYLMNNCWYVHNSQPALNQKTKLPEFPRNGHDNTEGLTDLTYVHMRNLRGKNGMSGFPIEIVVSQSTGVDSTLTEFNNIKESGRYGFVGDNTNYAMCFLPTVKLSRTKIRQKIDDDSIEGDKLRRAINMLSELCQMQTLWTTLPDEYMVGPEQLYQDLIDLGYDWDVLLTTRGWWTWDNDSEDLAPYLCTYDLLRMRVGAYVPYWLKNPPAKALELQKQYRAKTA